VTVDSEYSAIASTENLVQASNGKKQRNAFSESNVPHRITTVHSETTRSTFIALIVKGFVFDLDWLLSTQSRVPLVTDIEPNTTEQFRCSDGRLWRLLCLSGGKVCGLGTPASTDFPAKGNGLGGFTSSGKEYRSQPV